MSAGHLPLAMKITGGRSHARIVDSPRHNGSFDIQAPFHYTFLMHHLRATILAAGQGSRLLPLTATTPKCLLPVAGRAIIEHELNGLAEAGVSETLILTGFQAEEIENKLGSRHGSMALHYIRAPHYRTTNNTATLQLAADFLHRGGILLEGDVIWGRSCQQRLVSRLAIAPAGITWMASPFQTGMDGSVLVTRPDDRVHSMEIVHPGSALPAGKLWKSGGLLILDEASAKTLFSHIRSEDPTSTNKYFDCVIADHISDFNIRILHIEADNWAEIDTADDLQRAGTVLT
jgi:L-glutamine-phosphate cytidylyltransferase